MADSTDPGPLTITSNLKFVELKGQINWKINNFLDWAKLKKKGYCRVSCLYRFDFPGVDRSFKFALIIVPRGRGWPWNTTTNDIGILIQNVSNKKVNLKYALSLVNSDGNQCLTQSATRSFSWRDNYGYHVYTTHTHLASKKDTLLPGGCLHIQVDLTIFRLHEVQQLIHQHEG